MSNLNLKTAVASAIAHKANNKATRELTHDGMKVSGFEVSCDANSTFDKYCNTYLALVDYIEKHDDRSSVIDKNFIDPTEYQLPGIFNDLLSCTSIKWSKASTAWNKPVFSYNVGDVGEFLTPSYFNAFQERFANLGDAKLFANVKAFQPKAVTFDDLKGVVGEDGHVYINNPSGSYDPMFSEALNVPAPISNFSDYAAKGVDHESEAVVVWLSQQM